MIRHMKSSDRYAAKGVVAICRCCGRQHAVLNLSLGGMFVASDSRPRIGEPVSFDVLLPGHQPFRVAGTVAWVNDRQKPRAPELPEGFGLREQQIDLAGKLAVVQHLREHERDRLGRR